MRPQKLLMFLACCLLPPSLYAQTTPFEMSAGKQTSTYTEAISFYQSLDTRFDQVKMEEAGPTDAGYPLHVVYYSSDARFDIAKWKQQGKIILLINNGIHPGEPDGIDACMMLMRDAAQGKIEVPDNVVLAIIPVYNIGGALNRNGTSRANQNGPEAYGFRGNSQNLDLNRDFIKADAKESRSLEKLFRDLDPEIFIDNHVSDGADYQHIMTLLTTQHDKLGGSLGSFMHTIFEPALFGAMRERSYDMVPYVNDFDKTPDSGWTEFYDPPRYSSGYATLFQTMAFVPETHMLKPFSDRVWATYTLMRCFISLADLHRSDIKKARSQDRHELLSQTHFPLEWKADTTHISKVSFKGYTAGYKPSKISGQPRLWYDHSKPYTKDVDFYNHFLPSHTVVAPTAYVVPQGWDDVVKRLQNNGVEMQRMPRDTSMQVAVYRIDKFETSPRPYEKHYLHKNINVTAEGQWVSLQKGDYIIPTKQPAKRFIVETLEPTAPDGFFAWNFFDGILQQKEYYSDYVFEDDAARILDNDRALRQLLDEKKKEDPDFAKNGKAQLDFIYHHSTHYEPTHMRYPVFRIEN